MDAVIYLNITIDGKTVCQLPFLAQKNNNELTCPLWEMQEYVERVHPSLRNTQYQIQFSNKQLQTKHHNYENRRVRKTSNRYVRNQL